MEVGSQSPSASVIWLHGLGADGSDFVPLVPEFHLPENLGIRFVFPCAPFMPVTINGGYVMRSWYDILEANLERKIDVLQLRHSAGRIHQLIERELERGIDSSRIVVAGFSQGGAVALEAGLSCDKPLAGLLVLSSYFPTRATVKLHSANRGMPIFVQHGTQDSVVDESLGLRAFKELQALGYPAVYETYSMDHELCAAQIRAISHWLAEKLKG